MPRSSAQQSAQAAPHSWDLEHWPESVYPHTTSRARYLTRIHKHELIACGVLSRVGREFVFLGAPYTRWLQKQAMRAAKYDLAVNTGRSAQRA